ncbi:serine/threonine-protein kinase [Chlorogloeopsis sp. ULAP01]|uniref:serine/threonine-protein kinase n=1 Tax=Chlorogloeopsis sp. ULAP01 TaxID=3056483 RepID=UPI0025AB2B96|nr:serine/threonine-protein kinase [Chlorogloeopsis sp. ULAP01]MDM9383866.1 serine/threonine-protein kinase [Chlorogloeopsis sp. ULAP01]
MNSVYCSQGHENPSGSRFCLHCGERLDTAVSHGIQPGRILGDRYLIVRQLGQGGFGRTYLAEDVNRFRELCVLKEFSPQVQTAYVLQKAEELFEREATVLYKLQHPQIPRFRELFRSSLDSKEYLFLVQDYVEGQTYRYLLDARLKQGLRFTEAEVRQLLQQILPVLEYIHSLGVIHRDISPDNLMLRKPPQIAEGDMPVLIDFGGVKQVAATVASQYYQPGVNATTPPPTLLGKLGYAPPEQMQRGLVEPHSDLYALGATVLVLLTGKQPSELIDNKTLTWQWRREISLSPAFGAVLDKMLSPSPMERYQSARQVLQALTPPPIAPTLPLSPRQSPAEGNPPTQMAPLPLSQRQSAQVGKPLLSEATTLREAGLRPSTCLRQSPEKGNPPAVLAHHRTGSSPSLPPSSKSWWTPGKIILVLLFFACASGVSYWGVSNLISSNPDDGNGTTPQPTPTFSPAKQPIDPLVKYSPQERSRKQKLQERRQRLGVDENFYVSLVNQIFWEQNPSLQKRSLKDDPADAQLRKQWDNTAAQVLQTLTLLSSEARQRLGTYSGADRDRWKVDVNKLNVSSRALYDLGDAAFFEHFPAKEGKDFIEQPIGQVWHAFVADKLNAILAKSAFQKIVFNSGTNTKTVSGTLKGAAGKVFIAELSQNQLMEVKLAANSKILWSIYSPSGQYQLLEDSQKRSLSEKLPESGFYEFVLVSRASVPLEYKLSLKVVNPTPTPSPTVTSQPTSTPTPEPTPTSSQTNTPTPEPTSTPQNSP